MPDLGTFLKRTREQRGLDLRSLSMKTGVDSSTISRIENNAIETSLLTAYKICNGLGIGYKDLIQEVSPNPNTSQIGIELEKIPKAAPTLKDIEGFLDLFNPHKGGYQYVIAYLFNTVYETSLGGLELNSDEQELLLVPRNNMAHLFWQSSIFDFDIKFPMWTDRDNAYYFRLSESGGILAREEIVQYIKIRHRELREPIPIRHDIAHLERTTIERNKLSPILLLNSQLSRNDEIVRMFWEQLELHTFISRIDDFRGFMGAREPFFLTQPKDFLSIATVFIKLARWLDKFEINKRDWVDTVRKMIEYYNREEDPGEPTIQE